MSNFSKTYFLNNVQNQQKIIISDNINADIPIFTSDIVVIKKINNNKFEIYIDRIDSGIKINSFSINKHIHILKMNSNINIHGILITLGVNYFSVKYVEMLPDNIEQYLSTSTKNILVSKVNKFIVPPDIPKFQREKISFWSYIIPPITSIIPTLIIMNLLNFGGNYFLMSVVTSGVALFSGLISFLVQILNNTHLEKRKIVENQNFINNFFLKETKNIDRNKVIMLENNNHLMVEKKKIKLIDPNLKFIKKIIFDNVIKNPLFKTIVITKNLDSWSELSLENDFIFVTDDISSNLDSFDLLITDFEIDLLFNSLHITVLNENMNSNFQYQNILDYSETKISSENPIKEGILNKINFSEKTRNNKIFSNFGNFFGFEFSQDNIKHNWNQNMNKPIKIPIGHDALGNKFFVDFLNNGSGVHLLINGITGSGKSEFLTTLIYSLAINFPPEKVSFSLLDFKGGNLSKRVEKLPHVIDSRTNLDTSSIDRFFYFLKEELSKRQTIFNNLNINDIDEFHKLNNVDIFIPHLFIVIDEFTELKEFGPEYMNSLSSISRLGRSLGLHLILSSQKIIGNVGDEILANISTRISFKVSGPEESNLILGNDLASHLTNPGEFYIKNSNVTKVFSYNINNIFLDTSSLPETNETILEKIEQNLKGITSNVPNFVPENLPETLSNNDIGVLDKINHPSINFSFEENNIGIFGSPKSGKSNALNVISQHSKNKKFIHLFKKDADTIFNDNIIFRNKDLTPEIIDKIDFYLSNNNCGSLIIDDLDLFLSEKYSDEIINLLQKNNFIFTSSNVNISSKIINRVSDSFYLGTTISDQKTNYLVETIPGRALYKNEILQFSLKNTDRSIFIDSNLLNIIPNSINVDDISSTSNNQLPIGLNYIDNKNFNIKINKGILNTFTYDNPRDTYSIIKTLENIFPESYFIDVDGHNWQFKDAFKNYQTNLNDIPEDSVVTIFNLESFIQESDSKLFQSLLTNNSVLIFSEARYFNHSFDTGIKIFRNLTKNEIYIPEKVIGDKQHFALANKSDRILLPILEIEQV
ncbi:MAG: hypothetical protein LBC17_02185 [Lactobacillaceae bacterium]|jgi:hypothetical protein|nr:hypothetical protein [Lactobacillaceae bacterium]